MLIRKVESTYLDVESMGRKNHLNLCQLCCIIEEIEVKRDKDISSLWDMIYVGFPLGSQMWVSSRHGLYTSEIHERVLGGKYRFGSHNFPCYTWDYECEWNYPRRMHRKKSEGSWGRSWKYCYLGNKQRERKFQKGTKNT